MGGLLLTIKNWWERADRNQRIITLGGAGLLGLLLLGTFLFASRPHYAPLFSGMDDAERGQVVDAITAMGIEANYSVPGEVQVPADKREEIKMRLASTGKLPKSAHVGIEGLEKMNLMTTPAQEKVRIQSLIEGDLDRTIETLQGVQSAQVHITPGDDSPFTSTKKPASAVATIVENGTGNLTAENGRAIATLLQRSVPGLELQNVTVLNQHMEFLFNGADQNSVKDAGGERFALEEEQSHRRAREIQSELDTAFGAGTTIVSVHTELDLDTQKQTTRTETPTDAINTQKIIEKMGGAAGKALGVAGQASNTTPVTKDAGADPKSQYSQSNEVVNKGVSVLESSTEKTPGTVKSLVINVVADSTRIADTKQLALKSFIDGEVKNHAAETQTYATNITFVPFDTASAAEALKLAGAAASQSRMSQIIAMLPIGALLLIALMVMKQVSKFAKTQTATFALADGSTMALGMEGMEATHVGDPSAANILAAIEGLTGTGLVGADGHIHSADPALDVEDIKDKIHMPLEQLKKMAHERPQMVAMLIKSLLLEDRR